MLFRFCDLRAVVINFEKIPDFEQLPKQTIWSIEKGSQGFVWFVSDNTVWNYDGHKIRATKSSTPKKLTGLRKVVTDKFGNLWISSKNLGLFKLNNGKIEPFLSRNKSKLLSNKVTALSGGKRGLWVATDNGLNLIRPNDFIENFSLPTSQSKKRLITSIVDISDHNILVGTQKAAYYFNKHSFQFNKIEVEALQRTYINTVYKDYEGGQWIGTDIGLFYKAKEDSNFQPYLSKIINFRVNSIAVDKKYTWVGSGLNGLFRVDRNNLNVNNYRNTPNDGKSIAGNSIMALLDDSNTLFVSSFHGGINYFDTTAINLGKENSSKSSIHCSSSEIFYNIDIDNEGVSWLSSESGLIEYSPSKNKCINHRLDKNGQDVFKRDYPLFSFSDSLNRRWVTHSSGFGMLDLASGQIEKTSQKLLNKAVHFMFERRKKSFVLGARDGLYIYENDTINKVKTNNSELLNAEVHDYLSLNDNSYLFATNSGVAVLDSDNNYQINQTIQKQLPTKNILTLHSNNNQELWIGTYKNGLIKVNENKNLIKFYDGKNGIEEGLSIFSILEANDKKLWIGTNNGLIALDTESNLAHTFYKSDGLQGDYFIKGSAYRTEDGKLYFGGRNGLNSFYPKDINLNTFPPRVAITEFTRFGKVIQTGSEFSEFNLRAPINEVEELTLTHNDYVFGFEFAALDFADPSRNKFSYKLEGFDPEWTNSNADNRRASYTNLPSGNYTFQVKASNKDGFWTDTPKELKIKVLPAPWKTWWAYTLYALAGLALISFYFRWKFKESVRVTNLLKQQVAEKTQEIQSQKQKVEDLLEKKNEMFANVSHEFRTPLTLILGPINNLLKSKLHSEDIQSLKMVNRNANRLLTMIEQLLLLAKITGDEKINLIPQLINHQILSIFEIFKPFAEEKGVSFKLINNNNSAIHAVPNTIDTILGNLISNAIKYTPSGGTVTLNSYTDDKNVILEVKDTGPGLSERQKKEIFNRFSRLDSHSNIDGVGIGLSVVEEMIKVNNASIEVNSEEGSGSQFVVRFKKLNANDIDETLVERHSLVNQLAKTVSLESSAIPNIVESTGNKHNATILVIEDNDDMRSHIADTLKNDFHCLLADRGKKGIELAIEHVPDIIICDVMMPEMDGFKVSRIIRSNSTTSHIPLILLTALHDKESRIKGWRENIDAYLTKPFDAQELLLQLNNVLVIRDILKRKAGALIKAGKKSSVEVGLTKKDQEFVNKLNLIISKNYNLPNYQRAKLASDMAVSEKQLQRKLKALIDKNPMELLREFRLQKASEQLEHGYQVSIVSDQCGFNSISHFSQCFKAHYGLSPKKYQQKTRDN